MKKSELEQYRSIIAELEEVRCRINSGILSDTVVGSDIEFPYIQHRILVHGTDDNQNNRNDMQLCKRLEQQKKRIEKYIYSIPDSVTRRIFSYRYLDGKVRHSWQWIAFKIGGGNSADSVRKRVHRYIANNK